MKNFTLSIAMLLLSAAAFSQNNPCPDIQITYRIFTDNIACSSQVVVYATGDIASQKALKIEVFSGPGGTGTILTTTCQIVPANSPSSQYITEEFIVPCSAVISWVVTRYTASNGLCGGGTCGTIYTVNGSPLPIKISEFFTKRNGNSITLNWKSESEINAKEFIIERNMGNGFVPVGTVAAKNNGSGSSYSYIDNNNSKTITQYRLKMVDMDASFKLSEIKPVKGTGAVSDFSVFPNPSIGYAKVSIADLSEATNVEVIDNAGRIVKSIELKNTSTVEINNLQSGIYLVRITNKVTGDAITKKLAVSN